MSTAKDWKLNLYRNDPEFQFLELGRGPALRAPRSSACYLMQQLTPFSDTNPIRI